MKRIGFWLLAALITWWVIAGRARSDADMAADWQNGAKAFTRYLLV